MSLARHSLLLVIGRSSASLARLLVNLLVARTFGEALELTAEYQKVWLFFNTFFQLFLFGIPASLYYFVPRLEKERLRGFLDQSYSLLLLLGLLFALALKLLAPFAARVYGVPELPEHYDWFAVYACAMVAGGFLEPVLNLRRRFGALCGWLCVEAGLFMLCVLVPLRLTGEIRPAIIAVTVLGVIRFLGLHLYLRLRDPEVAWSRLRLPLEGLKTQLGWALPITMTSLVAYLAGYLDKNVIAAWFAGTGQYAVYQIGAMEVPFVSVLVGSVTAVLLPRLSTLQHQERPGAIADLLAKSVEALAWIVFPVFTLLMVIADLVFVALLGPAYEAAAQPFRLYLLLFPLRLIFYGQVLNTLGKGRWVFWTALGDLALNAALSLWLVRWLGFPGPALATVLATFVEIAVFLFLLCRTLREPLSRIVPFHTLWAPALAALLAGAGAWGLRQALTLDGLTQLAALCALHLLIYSSLIIRPRRLRQLQAMWKG